MPLASHMYVSFERSDGLSCWCCRVILVTNVGKPVRRMPTPLIGEDGPEWWVHYDEYVAASLHDDKSTQEFLALNALEVLQYASTCSCAMMRKG
jgi:hypothetical protein